MLVELVGRSDVDVAVWRRTDDGRPEAHGQVERRHLVDVSTHRDALQVIQQVRQRVLQFEHTHTRTALSTRRIHNDNQSRGAKNDGTTRQITSMSVLLVVGPKFHFHFHFIINTRTFRSLKLHITGSAEALHCCKANSKSIGKMENSTPCTIVTPENFILKLGIRDYVANITHYTNFHVHRFSGGFSTNR